MPDTTHKGSCLCGAVAFEISGALDGVSACHCGQCRKQSGHYWVSTEAPLSALTLTATDGLAWYHASDIAKRGFCNRCGSTLFWQHLDEDKLSISMSAFDTPTGLHLQRQDRKSVV